MFQPLPLSIGLRYLRARRRTAFISFISLASILGIVIGVVALIATVAVMSGFQDELRARILGMVAHATVSGVDGPVQDWPHVVALAREDSRVLGAAPYIDLQALLQGNQRHGAMVRGVLPGSESAVSELAHLMQEGALADLAAGGYGIVLGQELAIALDVEVGDPVNVFVSGGGSERADALPRAHRFTVVGIFGAGAQEYDLGLAVVHLADAQALARMGGGVSGVRLKVVDMDQAGAVARDLAMRLPGLHRVRDWSRDNAAFFQMLQVQKTVMFILLSLVVAIAAFNLVSSLVMLVQDKQADIAILRTLGLSPRGVMSVFVAQGTAIGLIGIGAGIALGVPLAWNLSALVALVEKVFDTELMPEDVYYISGVPTQVHAADVAAVAAVAFALCVLATLYPAWRASRTDPATALGHE